MKPTVSDVKELKKALYEKFNINAVKKEQGPADRFLSWFGDKVAPNLLTSVIQIVVVLFVVLSVLHYYELAGG